ncbi:MAG: PLP-dependent aminotransferase family protein [Merismopedia sp. SIO2A8]|nr:PLP-dependent aminotransferase family protein [Merismopedia sp. SIO2A8]
MDLVITLDRASPMPLYQQLSQELRQAVLTKRLKPNQKLPSSRALATSLSISRTTVTQSYDQLLSEGYLETQHGAGTFVCAELPDDYLNSVPIKGDRSESSQLTQLSRFGTHLATIGQLYGPQPECAIDFQVGSPSTEHFPMSLWRQLLSRHCRHSPTQLNYGFDAAGYMPLRTAIADYLGRSRAVQCNAEQVIIVNGSQQALNLIARLTLEPEDWVALEDPGYLGARHCFTSNGAQLQGIPIDREGLDVETLSQCCQPFKLLYVTPSHQFPTGATLSLPRRLALLQWAHQTETLVLEDDYDSEYRYGDRPIPALQGLDQHNSVIYIGTFSKILFPALRLGYLVVPPAWVPVISRAKWLCDRHSPTLEQYALTDFLTEGHFERLIRKMRHLYNQRRQVLVNALNHYFGPQVTILGENAGIHLMAKLETGLTDDRAITLAQAKGIGLISAQAYYLNTSSQGKFIFGYAQLDETEIVQGIQTLALALAT